MVQKPRTFCKKLNSHHRKTMASGSSRASSSNPMSVRGALAPLSNAELGAALSTSSAAQPAHRPGETPSLAQQAAIDAERNKRLQAQKKKQWRLSRTEAQKQELRQRDAERKRTVREQMTPEKRRLEREKDARRKAIKRKREKEERRQAEAMSIDRLLNNSKWYQVS